MKDQDMEAVVAFIHEDREDDQLVSVEDLNRAAEAEAKEDHEC